uniref:Uncharacterized protein n=1 Tax=Arundo donax TaxID=35708 RepID=A0A0A9HGI3_ARUDO
MISCGSHHGTGRYELRPLAAQALLRSHLAWPHNCATGRRQITPIVAPNHLTPPQCLS